MKRLLVSLLPLLLSHCDSEGTKGSVDTGPDATRETKPDTSMADVDPDTTPVPEVSTPDATPSSDPARSETVAGLTMVALESATVDPQTVIHLSIANDPTIPAPARVEWSVEQPNGSVSLIVVTSATEATFEANIVGGYRFAARAFDANGNPIATLTLAMSVMPANGLHIELSWHTPGDVNESDMGGDQIYFSVGSDVDLHVLHPKAEGVYFAMAYDCYWDNTVPEWGVFGPEDNPGLDRDDTDGAGPEITSFSALEPDTTYTVGVHYWNDWGFGNAFATLRIFIDGVLEDEWSEVELTNDDLWEAYTITNAVITRVGDTPKITPHYRGL